MIKLSESELKAVTELLARLHKDCQDGVSECPSGQLAHRLADDDGLIEYLKKQGGLLLGITRQEGAVGMYSVIAHTFADGFQAGYALGELRALEAMVSGKS